MTWHFFVNSISPSRVPDWLFLLSLSTTVWDDLAFLQTSHVQSHEHPAAGPHHVRHLPHPHLGPHGRHPQHQQLPLRHDQLHRQWGGANIQALHELHLPVPYASPVSGKLGGTDFSIKTGNWQLRKLLITGGWIIRGISMFTSLPDISIFLKMPNSWHFRQDWQLHWDCGAEYRSRYFEINLELGKKWEANQVCDSWLEIDL